MHFPPLPISRGSASRSQYANIRDRARTDFEFFVKEFFPEYAKSRSPKCIMISVLWRNHRFGEVT